MGYILYKVGMDLFVPEWKFALFLGQEVERSPNVCILLVLLLFPAILCCSDGDPVQGQASRPVSVLHGGHHIAMGGKVAADGAIGGPHPAHPMGKDDHWELPRGRRRWIACRWGLIPTAGAWFRVRFFPGLGMVGGGGRRIGIHRAGPRITGRVWSHTVILGGAILEQRCGPQARGLGCCREVSGKEQM